MTHRLVIALVLAMTLCACARKPADQFKQRPLDREPSRSVADLVGGSGRWETLAPAESGPLFRHLGRLELPDDPAAAFTDAEGTARSLRDFELTLALSFRESGPQAALEAASIEIVRPDGEWNGTYLFSEDEQDVLLRHMLDGQIPWELLKQAVRTLLPPERPRAETKVETIVLPSITVTLVRAGTSRTLSFEPRLILDRAVDGALSDDDREDLRQILIQETGTCPAAELDGPRGRERLADRLLRAANGYLAARPVPLRAHDLIFASFSME